MTRLVVLGLIAALQLSFIIFTLVLLFVTRLRGSRWKARGYDAERSLAGPLRRIMLGEDRGEELAEALGQLRPDVAVREFLAIGGARLSPEQRRSLALLVRPAGWIEQTLSQAASGKWWKRMEAARLSSMVCDERDERMVARLVTDPHAAVASAATVAIAGCASRLLVESVVRGLADRPLSIRLQQCNALRSHADFTTTIVVDLLSRPASAPELRAWVQLVEVLATPDALAAVVPLASHPDVEIRTSTARALRSCFSPEGAEAVTRLLRDEDWRVRAAAARAVGALNVKNAIPLLSECMGDEAWWVRFRAGLALADLSQEGRAALDRIRNSPDPFARDMATLIGGLSDGGRLELTSV
ncbi:MAG: HEAT repeat domain-containing protein [Gemmatimonadaceae bacterium]